MPHEDELLIGSRDFATDHWALFDLESDFSESTDVAADHPEVVQRLEQLWQHEAERNQVMPLFDDVFSRMSSRIPPAYPPRSDMVVWPGGSPISGEALPPLRFGFRMSVDVEVPASGAEGVLFVRGDWNGGCALYAIAGIVHFTFNISGEPTTVVGTTPLQPGARIVTASYTPGEGPAGVFTIECDGTVIGSAACSTALPMALPDGLTLGYDRGFPVDDQYQPPFPWTGRIHKLTIETQAPHVPPNVRAALHAD